MHKNTLIFGLKIFVLSLVFIIVFNIWDNIINANTKNIKSNTIENNNKNFKKVNSSWLWNTWIAISTNVWTYFKQTQEVPATIYQEIFSLSELTWSWSEAPIELIWKNMIIINEYRNILKTDANQLINSSYDKEAILKAYVEQLEYRYTIWVKSQQLLVKQNNVLVSSMENSNSKLEILKEKISADFKKSDSASSLENIDKYLELKKEYNLAKIYINYISQFLQQYSYFNKYAKNQATNLLLNKDSIIKNAYVVIPSEWWIEALQEFDLIFTEEQIRK